jgi:hypothetical protein
MAGREGRRGNRPAGGAVDSGRGSGWRLGVKLVGGARVAVGERGGKEDGPVARDGPDGEGLSCGGRKRAERSRPVA